jgi:alkanesulfonate monooxygenase SsuD/methylene tetrahydromethanopterin reductase-like flavin-dependent oxidoreductase (luciferase family)
MQTPQGDKEAGMQCALFKQLQRPKPWRENAAALSYKEAMAAAVHAEAVGCDAYGQTAYRFSTDIGHRSAPEMVLATLSQRTSRLRLGLGVVVLPWHHPYRVVEDVSTRDIVSDGPTLPRAGPVWYSSGTLI